MKSLSKFGVLLPVLTAIFTVLSLWSVNAARTTLLDVAIPLMTAILSSLLLWGLAHLLPMLGRKSLPTPMLDNINIFASVLVVVFLLWAILTPWVATGILIAASMVLTIFSLKKTIPALIVFMLIANLVAGGEGTIQQMSAAKASADPTSNSNSPNVVTSSNSVDAQGTELPDIYFIIPDRMPSIDAELEDGFNCATAFQQSLESLGFQVWPDSLSSDPLKPTQTEGTPTTRTQRYVTSALNYGAPIPFDISYNASIQMIDYPQVANDLKAIGYQYDMIGSWWPVTASSPSADNNFVYHSNALSQAVDNSFTTAFYDRTLLGWTRVSPLTLLQIDKSTEVARQEYQLQTINDIATGEIQQAQSTAPKFVFMHFLDPHPPYIFQADGQPQIAGVSEKQAYLDQIEYASTVLTKLAANLRAEDPTAIIIIEADEGMAYDSTEAGSTVLNEAEDNTEWNGTLSAWYVPFNTQGISITQILGDAAKYVENLDK
jgi:Sulfatase